MLHVPPRGFHRIRHCGCWPVATARPASPRLRLSLGVVSVADPPDCADQLVAHGLHEDCALHIFGNERHDAYETVEGCGEGAGLIPVSHAPLLQIGLWSGDHAAAWSSVIF